MTHTGINAHMFKTLFSSLLMRASKMLQPIQMRIQRSINLYGVTEWWDKFTTRRKLDFPSGDRREVSWGNLFVCVQTGTVCIASSYNCNSQLYNSSTAWTRPRSITVAEARRTCSQRCIGSPCSTHFGLHDVYKALSISREWSNTGKW